MNKIRVIGTPALQRLHLHSRSANRDSYALARWVKQRTQRGHAGHRDDAHLGWDRAEGVRLHHTPWSGMQFKTYELFTSGIFPFNIFRAWFTLVNQNYRKQNHGWGDDCTQITPESRLDTSRVLSSHMWLVATIRSAPMWTRRKCKMYCDMQLRGGWFRKFYISLWSCIKSLATVIIKATKRYRNVCFKLKKNLRI